MISFNVFENISNKFINNQFLASIVVFLILVLIISTILIIKEYNIKKEKLILYFLIVGVGSVLFKTISPQVYYIPDLLLILIIIYRLLNLNQKVTYGLMISYTLFIYFIFLSEPHADYEFDNNFIVALKPLAYLIILHLISELKLSINIKNILIAIIVIYPFLLLANIFIAWLETGYYSTRPYFLFENNFEIPFILYCFIALTFIYGVKDIKFLFILTAAVLLTGSRSGFIGYLIITFIFLLSLYGKKGLIFGSMLGSSVLAYFLYVRSGGAFNISIHSIDRLNNLKLVLSVYDFSIEEILKYPFGHGIYQKIPIGICEKASIYAEWSTGNMYNCDPIMMQSFVARSLFQHGIYILLLIPILYLCELRRVMGSRFAVLLIIPITIASFSVGGYSNGLAFLGLLLCIFSYNQNNHLNKLK